MQVHTAVYQEVLHFTKLSSVYHFQNGDSPHDVLPDPEQVMHMLQLLRCYSQGIFASPCKLVAAAKMLLPPETADLVTLNAAVVAVESFYIWCGLLMQSTAGRSEAQTCKQL